MKTVGVLLPLLFLLITPAQEKEATPCMPVIAEDFRLIAPLTPMGEELDGPHQQIVDHCIYQAADKAWHVWACIRGTKIGRLFYRWEGPSLDRPLKPQGVALRADPTYGEFKVKWGKNGEELLQAPHVIRKDRRYYMFYGGGTHKDMTEDSSICLMTSTDGRNWKRLLNRKGTSALFHGLENSRDPMILPVGDQYFLYYTAHPEGHGRVYYRTSKDLRTWSEPRVCADGGAAGTKFSSGECPFVVFLDGYYYLFRTTQYGVDGKTFVYRSKDPTNFGINDDARLITTLRVAAPEIFKVGNQYYITSTYDYKGVRIAKLNWKKTK